MTNFKTNRQLTINKISELGASDLFVNARDTSNNSGAGNEKYILSIEELVNLIATYGNKAVYADLATQGVDINTTSVMQYGINIFTTVGYTSYATKLPQPVTGRSTTIINNSTFYIAVYPSNTGGKINGIVNYPVIIPPDGKSYTFHCIENPLPGAWTWTPPATAQYEFPEITVSHTTGVATGVVTGDNINISTTGYGAGVAGGNITLLPNSTIWKTISQVALLTKFKLYTNILLSDINGVSGYPIQCSLTKAYLTAPNASGSTVGYEVNILQNETSVIVNGTNNTPKEIGDTDTLYHISAYVIPPIPQSLLGVGLYSQHYFSVGIYIPANFPTKDYKFKVILEYV